MGIKAVDSLKLFAAYKAKNVNPSEVSSEIIFKNLLGSLVSSVDAKTLLKSQRLENDIDADELVKLPAITICKQIWCFLKKQ